MYDETRTFLRALFAGVQEGFLTFTAIHPDRDRPAPSRHIPLDNEIALASVLAQAMAANACGWGVYFGVVPRTANLGRWKRGGKRDICALPALFVDLDGNPEANLARLAMFQYQPSCIVSSGGGIHAYWFISPASDLAGAERVLRGLAEQLGGDSMNVASSLRLPGSRNTKPPRHGASCRVIRLQPDLRYQLADFAPWASSAPCHPVCARRHGHRDARLDQSADTEAIYAVADCLIQHYGGYSKANGYLAALCPCRHAHDFPGCHFNFDPNRGSGMCFGRHGRLSVHELCRQLGLVSNDNGTVHASR